MICCGLYNYPKFWVDSIHHTLEELGIHVERLLSNVSFYPDHPLREEVFLANYYRILDTTAQYIKEKKLSFLININTHGWVHNPLTGRLIFEELDIPVVNLWWDDPRYAMHSVYRLFPPSTVWKFFSIPQLIHFVWDKEVAEGLKRLGGKYVYHCPTGVNPSFFRGNSLTEYISDCVLLASYKWETDWIGHGSLSPDFVELAKEIGIQRATRPDMSPNEILKSMNLTWEFIEKQCLQTDPTGESFVRFLYIMDKTATHALRDRTVIFLKEKLPERFILYGKSWTRFNIEARGEIWDPTVISNIYASAKTCLNVQGGNSHSGLPMRVYEITASGSILLTQNNPEVNMIFEPGKECEVFNSPEEALEKIEYYITNKKERELIAMNGKRRTLAEHTWENRLKFILKRLKEVYPEIPIF